MLRESLLAAIGLLDLARAQQIGTNTPEVNPSLPFSQCTSSGCTKVNTGVTLDANWRWLHTTTGYTNCYTGNTWDKSICTSSAVCGQQCAIDGADYANTYGIRTSGDALTLGFKTGNNLGSRTYLLNPAGNAYQMFRLKNREFTFDVDVSKLACGLNGALYFSEMPEKGAGAPGAKYGTGYCDAQCAQDLKFVNGVANNEGWVPSSTDQNSGAGKLGACCAEMDVWEANSISQAVTPHVCTGQGLTTCSSPSQCGSGTGNRYSGVCDKDGCDSNPFRLGNTSFYGPGKTVNTNAKITVTTQFITSGNSDIGTLTEIRRIYKQNGKVIPNAASNIAGIDKTNSVTSKFCSQQKSVFGDPDDFAKKGGLAKMGDAMGRGMVLVMSLWTDNASSMLWLDGTFPVGGSGPGVVRGTCDATSGLPANVVAQHPDASVTFSNIKFGAIGST